MAQRLGEAGLAWVVAVGEAVDPTPWYLGGAVRGDGLATLLQQLLTPERPIAGATWADLNGEAWRADEWMTAYLRSAERSLPGPSSVKSVYLLDIISLLPVLRCWRSFA